MFLLRRKNHAAVGRSPEPGMIAASCSSNFRSRCSLNIRSGSAFKKKLNNNLEHNRVSTCSRRTLPAKESHSDLPQPIADSSWTRSACHTVTVDKGLVMERVVHSNEYLASCETMMTPPLNSFKAMHNASMDSISKLFVGYGNYNDTFPLKSIILCPYSRIHSTSSKKSRCGAIKESSTNTTRAF